MSWFTPTRVLLNKCKWLSVKQLVFYHRVLTTNKIVKNRVPMYLHNKMNNTHPYKTRQATEGGIRFGEQFGVKSGLSRNSFCSSGTLDYNRLPVDVRAARSIEVFKYKLKKWVKSNIPVD